jgi:hypothetical protein
MAIPVEITVEKALDQIAARKRVPIGILSYDMEKETLVIELVGQIHPDEVNALLIKLGIEANFTEK